jgi:DNA-binding PadR family transcriptional regulator
MSSSLSDSLKRALTWLQRHGGDAAFDRNGVALAQGESASVYRSTWNRLAAAGLIEFYGGKRDGGKGYGRLRITESGRAAAEKLDPERKGYAYGNGEGRKHKRPLMQDDDPSEFFA